MPSAKSTPLDEIESFEVTTMALGSTSKCCASARHVLDSLGMTSTQNRSQQGNANR